MKHDIVTYGKIGEVTTGGAKLSQDQFLNDLLKYIDYNIKDNTGISDTRPTYIKTYLI